MVIIEMILDQQVWNSAGSMLAQLLASNNRESWGTVNKKKLFCLLLLVICKVVIHFVVNTWARLLCVNREHLVLLILKEFL